MKTLGAILFAVWVVLVLSSGTYAAAIPIHHYNFNGAGVIDLAGAADGTLLNGASVTMGKLNLDGVNDYVEFSQHIIPTTGSFSVAFFAQEPSPRYAYTEIISQGYSGGPGFYVGYNPSRKFRIGDTIGTDVAFPGDRLVHHYAVTVGTDTRLYIDGSLIKTFGAIGMTAAGDNTKLGCQFSGFGEFFGGNMDELWVFSGVLTAGEVATLAIPEPATIALLGLGMLGLRRKK